MKNAAADRNVEERLARFIEDTIESARQEALTHAPDNENLHHLIEVGRTVACLEALLRILKR